MGKPSNWARTDALLSQAKPKGSTKAAREWLKEGWKLEVPSPLEEFEAEGKERGRRGEEMRVAMGELATMGKEEGRD